MALYGVLMDELMDDLFARHARFVVRFRYAIVVFWLAAAVVLSGTLPSLGSEINDNNSAFLAPAIPSILEAWRRLVRRLTACGVVLKIGRAHV